MSRQAQFENVALLNVHSTERQCLVERDGETALLNNGNKDDQPPQINAAHAQGMRVLKQLKKDMKNERSKQVQEQVDIVAMYLFPVIFLFFNLLYWPYYLMFIEWFS